MSEQVILKIKDLPSPKGNFLLGHLPQFNAPNKHQVLERWVKECGNLFRINFVGKTFIVSADHEFNQAVLKLRPKEFRRFSKIDEILQEMGVLGVFNAEGEVWKRHRKPTSDALGLKKVKAYLPTIKEKTQNLLEYWQNYAKNETSFDVQKEFMRYTIDITTVIAFGYQMNTLKREGDKFQSHLEHIFPMINHRITAPIPYWRIIQGKKDKALRKSLKVIEGIIYQFINEAKNRLDSNPELKSKPSNFLEALLVEQENANAFSDKEIYSNVFTMLLAGEDTTSNSISWALYYLSQNPDLVQKIRVEILTVCPNKLIPDTPEEINKLEYTNAVVQEVIRLKPVSPNLYMQANKDIIIENLSIPKDTTIMLQNKVAQTSNQYFSDPEQFHPERWLKNTCPVHQKHSPEIVKAFGGGPRFCPGKTMAEYEMIIAISSICRKYDINIAVSPETISEHFAFTMYPKNLLIQVKNVLESN